MEAEADRHCGRTSASDDHLSAPAGTWSDTVRPCSDPRPVTSPAWLRAAQRCRRSRRKRESGARTVDTPRL